MQPLPIDAGKAIALQPLGQRRSDGVDLANGILGMLALARLVTMFCALLNACR